MCQWFHNSLFLYVLGLRPFFLLYIHIGHRSKVTILGIIVIFAYISVGTACCLSYYACAVPLLQHAVVEFTRT